jgi:hypothetical protein
MEETRKTNVILTKNSQRIKDKYAPIYGLKNLISGALIVWGKLSPQQQQEAIAAAHGLDAEGIVAAAEVQAKESRQKQYHQKPSKSA